jgi:hypothetical protein
MSLEQAEWRLAFNVGVGGPLRVSKHVTRYRAEAQILRVGCEASTIRSEISGETSECLVIRLRPPSSARRCCGTSFVT